MAVPVDLQVVAVSGRGRVQVGQAAPAGAQQRGGVGIGVDRTDQGADPEAQAGPQHRGSLAGVASETRPWLCAWPPWTVSPLPCWFLA